MKRFVTVVILLLILTGCVPAAMPESPVPDFDHIVLIVFENKGYDAVIGNPLMPTLNQLAQEYTLLTNYYAIRHPSLPNYLALIGGDTFGVTHDCIDCFVAALSLPELIAASGRTWRTYQEAMPEPCFLGNQGDYFQKHNPFVYFDSIRKDQSGCERNVVPLTALETDIAAGSLPNFIFITPNVCNDSHDCPLDVADAWLKDILETLTPALDVTGGNFLIVITFDEAQKPSIPGRLFERGGGRVSTILYSPLVKTRFQDPTRYNHYSLLKTISAAWGLQYLGHAADARNLLITAPWK